MCVEGWNNLLCSSIISSWTVSMDSTAGQPNDNNQYVRELEKQSEKINYRPCWGLKTIWSTYLIAREWQLATKQRLTQLAQMSTDFEVSTRYGCIKVLLFGWFWEQHRRKPFSMHSEGWDAPRCCCVPQGAVREPWIALQACSSAGLVKDTHIRQ